MNYERDQGDQFFPPPDWALRESYAGEVLRRGATKPDAAAAVVAAAGAGASRYGELINYGAVAFWDFSEPRAPFLSRVGSGGPLALRQAPGSRALKTSNGPIGNAVSFNGTTDYLYIPAEEIGALNIGATGSQVCVMAFVKRADSAATGCVAGIWREDNNNPGRQYALFVDLPVYGGDNKVCFHVSKTGGASQNIPYSRDYSVNGSAEPNRDWVFVGGSYDGREARSYIEGRFEPYLNYTEPGAPNGEGLTYDKNPYSFTLGLNSDPVEFTVGACKLTSGYSNFFYGELAALLILNRVPALAEQFEIQNIIQGQSVGFKNRLFQWNGTVTGVSALYGCSAYRGATAADESSSGTGVFLRTQTGSPAQGFVYRASTSAAGVALFACESVPDGLTTQNLLTAAIELSNANTADTVRFCIKIGNAWYATESTYSVAAASPSGGDWSLAEVKTITFAKTAALWRDLTLVSGSTLSLAGSARSSDLPDGEVTGWGVYSPAVPTGNIRFRNAEFVTL